MYSPVIKHVNFRYGGVLMSSETPHLGTPTEVSYVWHNNLGTYGPQMTWCLFMSLLWIVVVLPIQIIKIYQNFVKWDPVDPNWVKSIFIACPT